MSRSTLHKMTGRLQLLCHGSHELDLSPTERFSAWDDAVEPMFTMNIAQPLHDIATRIRLEGATAGQPRGYAL